MHNKKQIGASVATITVVALALASGILGSATPGAAQSGDPYGLTWSTVDGGGYTFSTGGNYSLGGTVGQPGAQAGRTRGPLYGAVYDSVAG